MERHLKGTTTQMMNYATGWLTDYCWKENGEWEYDSEKARVIISGFHSCLDNALLAINKTYSAPQIVFRIKLNNGEIQSGVSASPGFWLNGDFQLEIKEMRSDSFDAKHWPIACAGLGLVEG